MITVNYLDGVDNIRCDEHLFQWDNGQKLCLSGLNTYVPNLETVDVHFCNKISKLAITVKPTVVSNNIVAPIPNSLLQDPYPIVAYFYVPSDNGSRTIVMVTIPIEPKKRPSDFVLNEDEAIASLEAINNKVNTTLNNITVDYNNFKTNIEAELRDMVDNLQLGNADTVDGKHASDFVLKTEATSIKVNNAVNADYANSTGDSDTVDGKHASDFALKTDIPTSLPANGGNADTVGGKSASDFMPLTTVNSITSCDDTITPGSYGFYSGAVSDAPLGYGNWYRMDVIAYGSLRYQIIYTENGHILFRGGSINVTPMTWTNWRSVSDGGNASTVNGVRLMVGTREPQVEEPNALAYVPEGAWYGQYT